MRFLDSTLYLVKGFLMRADSKQLSECLEALCQCGCDAVLATIAAMESGQTIPQTEQLNEEERAIVLAELKSIMAVYDGKSCSIS